MNSIYKQLKHKLLHLLEQFLPTQCLICQLASDNKLICCDCQDALLQHRSCCLHCGLSLPVSLSFCGNCIQQKHHFTRLHALANYCSPYPSLIKELKYGKKLIISEALGVLLSLSIQQNFTEREINAIEYLIAVPLHHKKLRQRGFNQAALITEVVAKRLSIPIIQDVIERHRETVPQEHLSINKRKKNLHGAFSVNNSALLQNKHIAIIDDVVTTGATINSICQSLRLAGVASITVFCISRTDSPEPNLQQKILPS